MHQNTIKTISKCSVHTGKWQRSSTFNTPTWTWWQQLHSAHIFKVYTRAHITKSKMLAFKFSFEENLQKRSKKLFFRRERNFACRLVTQWAIQTNPRNKAQPPSKNSKISRGNDWHKSWTDVLSNCHSSTPNGPTSRNQDIWPWLIIGGLRSEEWWMPGPNRPFL